MGSTFSPWLSLLAVGALWGGTNPFIKRGSKGVQKWQYILPFLLNQCGSVVYFLTLQQTDLSLAVPIANALTFLFTALVGHLLGEEKIDKETLCGITLVVVGISLCVYGKI
ncbi:Hypothetical predicted protein [Cloeon dipterum]|uniref:EamA domain-containing protein n=1 Tax=Cloeon dipterum TaxID=197152 RepID=A0A8S1CRC4_9INSE|nr:Hypothetical predicted protein [Cloeon dipterum]